MRKKNMLTKYFKQKIFLEHFGHTSFLHSFFKTFFGFSKMDIFKMSKIKNPKKLLEKTSY